ncbi:cupin domain-containing protein [Runella aurantiaca]|uniref:Cupin domain-containing protein n=1 Tax=Runella aurantiaca TaxID=2282308 RepID=A0A369I888_9BACT|nr:cupin domain-containing protein [Runella aurantiaca]RDB05969.1 cupin domain-containing protein [Runella aurantiaca]
MERRTFLSSTIIAGVTINSGNALAHHDAKLTDRPVLKPFHLPAGAILTPGPAGINIRTMVKSGQTNKQISSIEGAIAAKTMGPSPHVHKELDEMMFVQEGTIHVLVGSEVYEVKAGGILFRPHGIVHTFWNASNQPARFMDMFFGQDFENYLEELFFKIMPNAMKKGLAPNSKEVLAQLEELDTRYGIVEFHEQRQAIVEKYGLK